MPQYTRFADIPQMARAAWVVTHPWSELLWKIKDWQDDLGLQIQPDFQRAHVWEPERSAKYVEYILRGGQSSRDIFFNHPGWQRSYKGDFVVVDGQQRLTAVMDFLNNKLPVFGGAYYRDFTDHLPGDPAFTLHVNNLRTRADVLDWYIALNEGGIAHTESELSKVRQMLAAEKERNS